MLAIVAFALARTSRALLLGEAASAKTVKAIKDAIESHPNVVKVVEILTMHLAPKQILINAHVNLRNDLMTDDIERTNEEIEEPDHESRAESCIDFSGDGAEGP